MSARDYFDGCDNVPMFELDKVEPMVGPLTATPNATLADAVRAAEARRAGDGQLTLPAEFMPIPAGALFA
jgi:hypothetical protein